MSIPKIPNTVKWRNGMVLEPVHFTTSDDRASTLAYLFGLMADPWPWGFLSLQVDETALASGQLRIKCEGIFPGGVPFRQIELSKMLGEGADAKVADFHISRRFDDGSFSLNQGLEVPSQSALPVAKLVFHGGVWSTHPDWSPPALLIDSDHPMRIEVNRQLGALNALAVGFATTLRLPGAEERPVARMLGQVSAVLAQGVGVIQALLASPAISPGRIGIEALRLALGVRGAVRIFDQMDTAWDAGDQRGSIRRLLYEAESAASGIGLPFRANAFVPTEDGMLVVDNMPSESLLLAIEASRPSDLIAGRSWLEGAALAAPNRIQDALNRRVAGCSRQPVERDARLGISSGPLLALYNVDNDTVWRGGQPQVALASKTPPPVNTSFSVLVPEEGGDTAPWASNPASASRPPSAGAPPRPDWAAGFAAPAQEPAGMAGRSPDRGNTGDGSGGLA